MSESNLTDDDQAQIHSFVEGLVKQKINEQKEDREQKSKAKSKKKHPPFVMELREKRPGCLLFIDTDSDGEKEVHPEGHTDGLSNGYKDGYNGTHEVDNGIPQDTYKCTHVDIGIKSDSHANISLYIDEGELEKDPLNESSTKKSTENIDVYSDKDPLIEVQAMKIYRDSVDILKDHLMKESNASWRKSSLRSHLTDTTHHQSLRSHMSDTHLPLPALHAHFEEPVPRHQHNNIHPTEYNNDEASEPRSRISTVSEPGHNPWLPVRPRRQISNEPTYQVQPIKLPPRQSKTDANVEEVDEQTKFVQHKIRGGLCATFSGIYGMLLVVAGAVIPLAELFEHSSNSFFYELFYVYLFLGSITFMGYVYFYLLRTRALPNVGLVRTAALMKSLLTNGDQTPVESPMTKRRRRRTSTYSGPSHTGSFFLRLGALAFGIGGMIHSGLQFGGFVSSDGPSYCNGFVEATKPAAQMIFTFLQTYFIFSNSKMCINKYQTAAKFGLMHMIATNLCVWFRGIVVETLHELHHNHHLGDHGGGGGHDNNSGAAVDAHSVHKRAADAAVHLAGNVSKHPLHRDEASFALPEIACNVDSMLSSVIQDAGPYLYPCTIEYSLICAGVTYVMWRNVGKRNVARRGSLPQSDEEVKTQQHMTVDCSSSNRGLFLGILTFVLIIISIIAFYVLVQRDDHETMTATYFVHMTDIVIYLLGTFVVLMAFRQMRALCYFGIQETDLEDNLLIMGVVGLYMFAAFSIIPAPSPDDPLLVFLIFMANFCLMMQATLQTAFVLTGLRVCVTSSEHEREKPGREWVTYLLVFNIALWVLTTFETQKPEHNRVQKTFYGDQAWAIFSHISVPLAIFYRFHSTVLLCNIWKGAWKLRSSHAYEKSDEE